jgi:hypothetical protein
MEPPLPSSMRTLARDWDRCVAYVDDIAREPGFQGLRDLILDRADPRPEDWAVDVGSGTGLRRQLETVVTSATSLPLVGAPSCR